MIQGTNHSRLSDIEMLLLSAAITRPDGSLLPPSETLGRELSDRIRKALGNLLRQGLAEECENVSAEAVWRKEGARAVGLVITLAGRAALANAVPMTDTTIVVDSGKAPATSSKIGIVIDLLRRPNGASLAELTGATGWLPHTVRAALTGLRRKGHVIIRESIEGTTRWRIAEKAR